MILTTEQNRYLLEEMQKMVPTAIESNNVSVLLALETALVHTSIEAQGSLSKEEDEKVKYLDADLCKAFGPLLHKNGRQNPGYCSAINEELITGKAIRTAEFSEVVSLANAFNEQSDPEKSYRIIKEFSLQVSSLIDEHRRSKALLID